MPHLWPFDRRGHAQVAMTEDYRALGYPDQRKIARDSRGRLFVAFRKKHRLGGSLRYHVFVARSDDGGTTWQVPGDTPIERVGDYTQRVPAIAIDAADVVHVVWYGNDADNQGENERQIKYARSPDAGATWSRWVNLAPVAGYRGQRLWQEHPVIYATGANLYVAWQGLDAGHPEASQVKLIRSSDGGATWTAWRNVSPTTGGNHSRPAIVATEDGGRLSILAYGSVGGTQQIVWTSSVDGGDTWMDWSQVAPAGVDQRHVSLALDRRGRLHAVWRQDDGSGRAQIHYAAHDGARWSAPELVGANPSAHQLFPTLAAGPAGQVCAAWIETDSASGYPADDPKAGRIAYASKPNEDGWGPRSMLAGAGDRAIYPSLRCDSHYGGVIDIVWLESDGGTSLPIRYGSLPAR